MDSAKNYVPYFATGRKPKDIEDNLANVLQLHVAGVLIHGNRKGKYIFWALPNLPGNANLNLETVRRALNHYLRDATFRPQLHLQFDGASDNLNMTFLAWADWLCSHAQTAEQGTDALATGAMGAGQTRALERAMAETEGKVSKAELVMLPLGHTHEDIDALWRFVADSMRRTGVIRTMAEFEDAARSCVAEGTYVEQIAWVYDYTRWFKPHIHPNLKGIKSIHTQTHEQTGSNSDRSVRYFTMARREADKRVVMWYKKGPSHADLYPSQKDPTTGQPMRDNESGAVVTCPEGIEIL